MVKLLETAKLNLLYPILSLTYADSLRNQCLRSVIFSFRVVDKARDTHHPLPILGRAKDHLLHLRQPGSQAVPHQWDSIEVRLQQLSLLQPEEHLHQVQEPQIILLHLTSGRGLHHLR